MSYFHDTYVAPVSRDQRDLAYQLLKGGLTAEEQRTAVETHAIVIVGLLALLLCIQSAMAAQGNNQSCNNNPTNYGWSVFMSVAAAVLLVYAGVLWFMVPKSDMAKALADKAASLRKPQEQPKVA